MRGKYNIRFRLNNRYKNESHLLLLNDTPLQGERRRLIIPPALGYGAAGVPRRGIPPSATLQYDISLVSINGLATPQ